MHHADLTPDLSTYHQIHRGLRRSAAQVHHALAGMAVPDRTRARVLARWYERFAAELHDHHVIEDTVFFPALAERVPVYDAYSDTVVEDHAHLERVLTDLLGALRGLAGEAHWETSRARATELAAELSRHLDEHLAMEDQDLLPLFARHFNAAEYEALHQRALKSVKPKQLFFTVPWLASHLEPHEVGPLFDGAPFALKLVWYATRRRYARQSAFALGAPTEAVAA